MLNITELLISDKSTTTLFRIDWSVDGWTPGYVKGVNHESPDGEMSNSLDKLYLHNILIPLLSNFGGAGPKESSSKIIAIVNHDYSYFGP